MTQDTKHNTMKQRTLILKVSAPQSLDDERVTELVRKIIDAGETEIELTAVVGEGEQDLEDAMTIFIDEVEIAKGK
jgi:hypothetical protein